MSTWAWAHQLWTTSFAPLGASGWTVTRLDDDAYWALHEAELRGHFIARLREQLAPR